MYFFIGVADYNFGIVPYFTRFHWANNAHGEILPVTSNVNAYFKVIVGHIFESSIQCLCFIRSQCNFVWMFLRLSGHM